MASTIIIGGANKELEELNVNISGVWKSCTTGYANINGVWREFFKALVIDPVLNNNDWATIRAVSDAGLAANYWNVGDRKGVVLNGQVGNLSFNNETYYCYIIGFDHNASLEGNNYIHFQFGFSALSGGKHIAFTDSRYNTFVTSGSWFNMNNSDSNSGGWSASSMRNNIMPAFKNSMPSELQNVIKPVIKYTDNVGKKSTSSSSVTSTTESVFLLSEYEIFGLNFAANTNEVSRQKRYSYYSSGNSILRYRADRVEGSYDAYWWQRTPNRNSKTGFCCVNPLSGKDAMGTQGASRSRGIAPAFCV